MCFSWCVYWLPQLFTVMQSLTKLDRVVMATPPSLLCNVISPWLVLLSLPVASPLLLHL